MILFLSAGVRAASAGLVVVEVSEVWKYKGKAVWGVRNHGGYEYRLKKWCFVGGRTQNTWHSCWPSLPPYSFSVLLFYVFNARWCLVGCFYHDRIGEPIEKAESCVRHGNPSDQAIEGQEEGLPET